MTRTFGVFCLAVAALGGCVANPPAAQPSLADRAQALFDDRVAATDATLAACQQQLATQPSCDRPPPAARPATRPQSFTAAGTKICDILRPLEAVEHPYFFHGISASGGFGTVGIGGVDEVFDLWNQQAAAFTYEGAGVESLVGVQAGLYEGFAFGDMPDVITAWSGEFITGTASVATPLVRVSVGGEIFTNPDLTLWGYAWQTSVGLAIEVPVDLSVTIAEWMPWNAGTELIDRRAWFVGDVVPYGNGYELVQFDGGGNLALAILLSYADDPAASTAAAEAIAIDVLRSLGVSIKQLCEADPCAAADLDADVENCGACGNVCAGPAPACVNGRCLQATPPDGGGGCPNLPPACTCTGTTWTCSSPT
ncbi:MAG TPA: hypothetical protein VGL86_18605 [Polyangia bacterium]|jgi:hypothetical protein